MYDTLLLNIIQECNEKQLREKIQKSFAIDNTLPFMRDRNGNSLAHYWILLRHTLPPKSLIVPNLKNNRLETLGHIWIKHTQLPLPQILIQNKFLQDADGNTYGHLFIIFRQQLPPINLINSLRNNNGLNMAQLYNICVSVMVPKILLPRLQKIHFECPVCYTTKTHECPCLSCKHRICLNCWLRCKNCPICRATH